MSGARTLSKRAAQMNGSLVGFGQVAVEPTAIRQHGLRGDRSLGALVQDPSERIGVVTGRCGRLFGHLLEPDDLADRAA